MAMLNNQRVHISTINHRIQPLIYKATVHASSNWGPILEESSSSLPSDCVTIAIENGPVEIVDLPIDSMVIFHSYVSLPEGIYNVILI